MRRFIVIAIPIGTLALFIFVMLSSRILKMPLGKEDNIPKQIQIIQDHVKNERWEEVDKEAQKLNEIWNNIVTRVQFSAERDEINSFNVCLARLNGAITAKDKTSALLEINEALEHWKNIGK